MVVIILLDDSESPLHSYSSAVQLSARNDLREKNEHGSAAG